MDTHPARVTAQGHLLTGAALVGLGAADQQAQLLARHLRDVAPEQPHQFGAPQRCPRAQQQQRPVTGTQRRRGGQVGVEQGGCAWQGSDDAHHPPKMRREPPRVCRRLVGLG